MQVAQPVRDPAGRTLLEKGAVLTDDLIARLKKFGVSHLEVEGMVAAGDLTAGTVRDMLEALSEEYPTRTLFGCAVELRAHGMPAVEALSAAVTRSPGDRLPAVLGLLGQVGHVFTDAVLDDFLPVVDVEAAGWADDTESGEVAPMAGADLPGLDVHDAKVRETVLGNVLPPLLRFMAHDDARVRLAAARGLAAVRPVGEGGLAQWRAALEAGLDDPNAEVALACALGLERDPTFLDERGRFVLGNALLQVLSTSQAPGRYQAVLALGRLDVPGGRAVLLEMLDDAAVSIRRSALYALGDLRDGRALEPALQLAVDEDDGTRAWACRCLGRLDDAAVVPVLVNALHDPQEHVVRQAVDGLLAIGELSESTLLVALSDADWFVRADVCYVLARVGSPRALAPLKIRGGSDEHRFVREAAAAAAEAILKRHGASARD